MPIPLGILAQAGRTIGGGSYELIETVTVGSGGAASVTFSNLNTYNTTYQHLQIRAIVRDTRSLASSQLIMRFNSDTGTNYNSHQLSGNGSSVASYYYGNSDKIFVAEITGASATSGNFGVVTIDLLDPYETTKFTTMRALGGIAGDYNWVDLRSGLWRNTNALTSITFTSPFGNFVQYCRFSLYGLKGS